MKNDSGKKNISGILSDKQIIYPAVLLFVFLLILLNQYQFILKDNSIPFYDWADHYNKCAVYSEMWQRGAIGEFFLECLDGYPTLAYQISAPFMILGGRTTDWATLSQSVFWFILFFSIYFLGAHLWNPETGALSAVFSLAIPFVNQVMMLQYILDLPCASMTALCLLMLFKTGYLEKGGWNVAFFVCLGLACLTKWASVFFIMPLFLIFLSRYLFTRIRDKQYANLGTFALWGAITLTAVYLLFRYTLKNPDKYIMGPAIFLAVIIVISLLRFRDSSIKGFYQGTIIFFILIWHIYAIHYENVFRHGYTIFRDYRETPPGFLDIFVFQFTGVFFSIFTFTGILYYLFTKDKNAERNCFALAFVISIITLLLLPSKQPRFFTHITVFVSIISTFWIPLLPRRIYRIPAYCILILGFLVSIHMWNFEDTILKNERIIDFLKKTSFIIIPPDPSDWKSEEVGYQLARFSGGRTTFVLLVNDGYFESRVEPLFIHAGRHESGKNTNISFGLDNSIKTDKLNYRSIFIIGDTGPWTNHTFACVHTLEKMLVVFVRYKDNKLDIQGSRLQDLKNPYLKKLNLSVSEKIWETDMPFETRTTMYRVKNYRESTREQLEP